MGNEKFRHKTDSETVVKVDFDVLCGNCVPEIFM